MMNKQEAQRITSAIHEVAESLSDLVIEAYDGRAWEVLGYPSWNAYVDAEFDTGCIKIPRDERVKAVVALRQRGMSTRDVADTLGVSQRTVVKDVKSGEYKDSPETITGRDGKSYPSTKPKPDKPVTRPLGSDEFDQRRGHLQPVESETVEWVAPQPDTGTVNLGVARLGSVVRKAIEAAESAQPMSQADWVAMAGIAGEVDRLNRMINGLVGRLAQ